MDGLLITADKKVPFVVRKASGNDQMLISDQVLEMLKYVVKPLMPVDLD